MKIGIQLQPQHTTTDELREAWKRFDRMGVDSLWTWDHFYPLYGAEDGNHFEGWSLLAAMAADTSNAQLGMLVTCLPYRNVDLLADIARTVDNISGGRLYLGVGAGWFERDFDEYGYDFGTVGSRITAFVEALPRLKARLARLTPPPAGRLPLLIGGSGERRTLRLVAEQADAWNTFGPASNFAQKNAVLDQWCAEVGRDPKQIERTVLTDVREAGHLEGYAEAGADHVILALGSPFDPAPIEAALAWARR